MVYLLGLSLLIFLVSGCNKFEKSPAELSWKIKAACHAVVMCGRSRAQQVCGVEKSGSCLRVNCKLEEVPQ